MNLRIPYDIRTRLYDHMRPKVFDHVTTFGLLLTNSLTKVWKLKFLYQIETLAFEKLAMENLAMEYLAMENLAIGN